MFARVILALGIAIVALIGVLSSRVDAPAPYTLEVDMASSPGSALQVFLDTGTGFSEALAPLVPTLTSPAVQVSRLPLAAGQYFSLRIDPGTVCGRFTLDRIAIVNAVDRAVTPIPLRDVRVLHDLAEVERTDTTLVVECTAGATDPQLLYSPSPALTLPASSGVGWRTAASLPVYFVLALAGLLLLEHVGRGLGRRVPQAPAAVRHWLAARPRAAVMIVALVASTVASYPTLFLGRTLASPTNGGMGMLYNHAPYNPGSSDLTLEFARGADVEAATWAFVPYSRVQRAALEQGEWPLWNRYNSLGVPLWGQGQTFLLDPLHWLTLLGSDPALGWDLKFAAHRFVFACGVGIAALVATGAWLPASIAAAGAPFIGLHAFRFNHPATFVLTYAPWLLAGWFLLAAATSRRTGARAALMIGLAVALVLVASPPKEALVMLVVTGLAGVLSVLLTPATTAQRAVRLGAAAIAGATAVALTAPHWLVFVDTLRAATTMYGVPGVQLADRYSAAAMILGPLAATLRPGVHLVGFSLALAGVFSSAVWRRPPLAACAITAAVAIGLAYGAVPAAWLVRLPFFANIISIDITVANTVVVLVVILAAAGVHALIEGRRVSARVASFGAATAGGAAMLTSPVLQDFRQLHAWLVVIAVGMAMALPFALSAARATFPQWKWSLGTALLLALSLLPGGQHVETGLVSLDLLLQQPRPRAPLHVTTPAVDAVHQAAFRPTRVVGTDSWLYAGTQALYGLEGTGGPDALFLGPMVELESTPDPSVRFNWERQFPKTELARDATLLDLLNVGFLMSPVGSVGPGFENPLPSAGPDELMAFRRPTAWPRAFFVDHLTHYDTPNDLLAQARAAGGPIAGIQAGDREAAALTEGVGRVGNVMQPADHYQLTANATRFRVTTVRGGIAVLSESHMAGDFVATLNGRSVPYFRVNHAFKGIVIPAAGQWEVSFEYRPRHWGLALWIAAVGVAMAVGLAWFARRPTARPSGQDATGA